MYNITNYDKHISIEDTINDTIDFLPKNKYAPNFDGVSFRIFKRGLRSEYLQINSISDVGTVSDTVNGDPAAPTTLKGFAQEVGKYFYKPIGFNPIPEAIAVFERLTTLTQREKVALNKFLICEIDAGNYAKQDDFMFFGWTNAADNMKGFKSKSITNLGDGVFGADGLNFSGINDIPARTNINPAALSQFKTNDARVSVHLKRLDALVDNTYILCGATTGGLGVKINQLADRLTWQVGASAVVNESTLDLATNTLYSAAKVATTATRMTRWGTAVTNKTVTDAAFPSVNLILGGNSFNSSQATGNTIDGAILCMSIGAHADFDYQAHWLNYSQFLTDLGL